ncbi:MAG: hypothetical protein EHM64_09345 [Ignavibacteriae bacterium]|nr:MAG: hypothetical protein EHM64_09345 [Ignavibacteriota bacterium]
MTELSTEQLLQQVRNIRNFSVQPAVSGESLQDVKCGFGIHIQIANRWKEFSPAQRAELSLLIKPSVMQTDTTAGHFHIFYDTTGINEPALLDNANQRIPGSAKAYIHEVAAIFNHVWDVEIDQLGYEAPPFEDGQSHYNIHVENISDYGDTWRIEPPTNGSELPPRYKSYISVDNDYRGFSTSGLNGLKVTAAHEFHHAIQMGSYGLWSDDVYAHELTSTWMEDVVYTEVNDYYNYLPDYFSQFGDGRSFNWNPTVGGYERSVFAFCLAKLYGAGIMKDIWTGMRSIPFLESADAALVNRGSRLQSAYAEFTKWNYFTWDRANTVDYYPEGNHYPRFRPLQKLDFYNTSSTASGEVQALSSSMYEFDMPHDTLTAVIANVDMVNAIMKNTSKQTIDVLLSSQALPPPYTELANGLKAKISVDSLSLWHSLFLHTGNEIVARVLSDPAPNPFRLSEARQLLLPIHEDKASRADVYIYNSALGLAYSGQLQTSYSEDGGTRVIVVPASAVESKLSTGIYFIIANTVNGSYKWKVAVIR